MAAPAPGAATAGASMAERGRRIRVAASLAALILSLALLASQVAARSQGDIAMPDFDAVGLWATADNNIRHELLAGGRYFEARGDGSVTYRGAYQVTGNHIDYQDDTGFTANGEFRNGILYHAGMVLTRQSSR